MKRLGGIIVLKVSSLSFVFRLHSIPFHGGVSGVDNAEVALNP